MTVLFHDDFFEQGWIIPTIKICLLLATAVSVHVSLSPPNPSVKSEECCSGTEGTETLFERFVQSITYCSKSMVWIGAFWNIIDIILQCIAPFLSLSTFAYGWCGFGVATGSLSRVEEVHSVMIMGAISAVVSAALRMWCFRTLGPFFTFEITIRPKHELITHGPYAWVRHPSYTGVYLTLGGATLVLSSPGTWTADHGVWTPLGFIVMCLWLSKCLYAFRGMCIRLRAEDRVLKDAFGAEWDRYATRVPFNFIPGVI